jgi:hypothetical protein
VRPRIDRKACGQTGLRCGQDDANLRHLGLPRGPRPSHERREDRRCGVPSAKQCSLTAPEGVWATPSP